MALIPHWRIRGRQRKSSEVSQTHFWAPIHTVFINPKVPASEIFPGMGGLPSRNHVEEVQGGLLRRLAR